MSEKALREAAELYVNEKGFTRNKYLSITRGSIDSSNYVAFLAGANYMRAQFKMHGTGNCMNCEHGRSARYVARKGFCLTCLEISKSKKAGAE